MSLNRLHASSATDGIGGILQRSARVTIVTAGRNWGRLALLALIAAIPVMPAAALDWTIDGGKTSRIEFNDNVNLSVDNPDPSFGFFLTPEFRMIGRSEVFELRVEGEIDFDRYEGINDRDTEDPSLNISARRQFENSSLSLRTGYSEGAARKTQLEDTGQVNIEATRKQSRYQAELFADAW